MPIFIPVDIMEDVFKLVVRNLLRCASPSGMDSEALQGWLLKFGYDSKKLCISVEAFVEWMTNQIPPWAAYQAFMSGCLIALDK